MKDIVYVLRRVDLTISYQPEAFHLYLLRSIHRSAITNYNICHKIKMHEVHLRCIKCMKNSLNFYKHYPLNVSRLIPSKVVVTLPPNNPRPDRFSRQNLIADFSPLNSRLFNLFLVSFLQEPNQEIEIIINRIFVISSTQKRTLL